ncbi:hypothetical protein X777_10961, partial [Ooceraea biroi]
KWTHGFKEADTITVLGTSRKFLNSHFVARSGLRREWFLSDATLRAVNDREMTCIITRLVLNVERHEQRGVLLINQLCRYPSRLLREGKCLSTLLAMSLREEKRRGEQYRGLG